MEQNVNLDEDGVWKDKEELRKLQSALTETLAIFHDICIKNHISYVMFGGTLLGAVRHKGFIPWDNDVDVAVERSEFEKLEKILERKLPPHLKVQTPNTDPRCFSQIMRIRNVKIVFETPGAMFKGSVLNGAIIDIFPLDQARKEFSLKMALQAYLAKRLLSAMSERSDGPEWTDAPHDSLKHRAADMVAMTIPREKWIQMRKKTMMWERDPKSPYYINLCSHYDYRKQVYLKEKIFPATELTFENYKFRAPADYDYVLKKFYGEDYMKIPSKKDRHMEDHIITKLKVED